MSTPPPEEAEVVQPSVLNFLLQTCIDGQEGYLLASEAIHSSELKATLATYAAQRARFGRELKTLLDAMAEPPTEEPTLAGSIHRGWINLKAVVKDGDEHAVLVECVRGEASALERYDSAIAEGKIPPEAESAVRRQAMEIKNAHDQMEFLSQRAKEKSEAAEET